AYRSKNDELTVNGATLYRELNAAEELTEAAHGRAEEPEGRNRNLAEQNSFLLRNLGQAHERSVLWKQVPPCMIRQLTLQAIRGTWRSTNWIRTKME
ncbi:uncharacterized protein A1O9_01413, partial [Exophiala aquamarina CBS 119918]